MNTNRNCMIDLMRFLFSLMIVLHHAKFKTYTVGGYIGVEFFFIISGFFMYEKFIHCDIGIDSLKIDVFKECFNKIKKFYTEFIIAYFIAFIVIHVVYINNVKALIDNINIAYGELMLLQIYGFPAFCATGVAWFLSALMGSYCIIVNLIKRLKDLYLDFLPIILLVCYGYIICTYNQIGVIEQPFLGGLLRVGLLRAFADMSVGILLGLLLYKYGCYMDKINKSILTIVEIIGYVLVFYIAFTQKIRTNIDFMLIVFMSISILISVSNYSYTSKIRSNLINALGVFSLNIYLNHFFVSTLVFDFCGKYGDNRKLAIYLVTVILLSVVNYKLSRIVRYEIACRIK